MGNNNITELVMILDRSGSMAGLESDTIGGFNAMLEKQKKQEGTCYVTTVLFDSTIQTLHDRLQLDKVRPITCEDYTVGGCTALLDAVGGTIRHVSDIHRYVRPEDVPAHTLFVIITDGLENASRNYRAETVKRMINQKKEDPGWEFLFLGANIDAVSEAARIGIGKERAVTYCSNSAGVAENFNAVGDLSCSLRATGKLDVSRIEKLKKNFKEKSGIR